MVFVVRLICVQSHDMILKIILLKGEYDRQKTQECDKKSHFEFFFFLFQYNNDNKGIF